MMSCQFTCVSHVSSASGKPQAGGQWRTHVSITVEWLIAVGCLQEDRRLEPSSLIRSWFPQLGSAVVSRNRVSRSLSEASRDRSRSAAGGAAGRQSGEPLQGSGFSWRVSPPRSGRWTPLALCIGIDEARLPIFHQKTEVGAMENATPGRRVWVGRSSCQASRVRNALGMTQNDQRTPGIRSLASALCGFRLRLSRRGLGRGLG